MPKKVWGANDRATEARDRKARAKAEEEAAAEKKKEDDYWRSHANPKGRKDLKREDAEAKREEVAARRADAKRFAAAEEEALLRELELKTRGRGAKATGPRLGGPSATTKRVPLASSGASTPASARSQSPGVGTALRGLGGLGSSTPSPGGGGKVTRHELNVRREQEAAAREAEREQRKLEARREVRAGDYAALVDVENTNAIITKEGASGLDAALEHLALGGTALAEDGAAASGGRGGTRPGSLASSRPGSAMGFSSPAAAAGRTGSPGPSLLPGATGPGALDRHPEKRGKALFEAYFEEQLPSLKERKPGLRLMQYKSMIFESWTRSPENPRNQLPK